MAARRQKRHYLPALAAGDLIGSFCLTEPDSGSDAASLKTTARKEGDHYVLNGTKRYITNAPEAGIFTVMAAHERREGRGRHLRVHRGARFARPVTRQAGQEDGPARRAHVRRDLRRVPRFPPGN